MRENSVAGMRTTAEYSVSGMPRCSLSMSISLSSKSEILSFSASGGTLEQQALDHPGNHASAMTDTLVTIATVSKVPSHNNMSACVDASKGALGLSKTNVQRSTSSCADIVMMSSDPAHFNILYMRSRLIPAPPQIVTYVHSIVGVGPRFIVPADPLLDGNLEQHAHHHIGGHTHTDGLIASVMLKTV